eukprot:950905_1
MEAKLGKKILYNNDRTKQFYYAYSKIKCLSLLPLHLVQEGWQIVQDELLELCPYGFKTKLRSFISYFNETWMDGLYSQKDWNFHDDHERTQNQIERSHRSWLDKMGKHPWIWPFMEKLQEIEALTQLRLEQIMKHKKTRLKSPDEREKEDQLNRLWRGLDAGVLTIPQFLTCASVAVKTHFVTLEKLYLKYDIWYNMNSGDMTIRD